MSIVRGCCAICGASKQKLWNLRNVEMLNFCAKCIEDRQSSNPEGERWKINDKGEAVTKDGKVITPILIDFKDPYGKNSLTNIEVVPAVGKRKKIPDWWIKLPTR